MNGDSTQGDLFAQEGMARAEHAADPRWLTEAKRIVWHLAQLREPFTSDQVWYRLEAMGLTTQEPRALGAVIRAASKAGYIDQCGYRPTTRPEAHARPIPIWVGTGKKAEAA